MSNSAYPQLDQMLSAYFHQDWCDEHDTEADVITDFLQTAWRDEVERTIEQIDRYLADHPTDLLRNFEQDFVPMVSIGTNDEETRMWLENTRGQLIEGVATAPVRSGPPR